MSRRLCLPTLVLGLVAAAQGARAETFELRAILFCPEDGTRCGFSSKEEFRDTVLWDLGEVNKEYATLGIAFHLQAYDIVEDDRLASLSSYACKPKDEASGKCDPLSANGVDRNDDIMKDMNALYATPDAVPLFLTTKLRGPCWSGGWSGDDADPFTFKDGVYCRPADPDAMYAHEERGGQGTLYAHELGHFFCLSHTHTKQDNPTKKPIDRDGDDCMDGDPNTNDVCKDPLPRVLDTPADPAPKEKQAWNGTAKPGDDWIKDTSTTPPHWELVEQHEFCEVTLGDKVGLYPDSGSAHDTMCKVACYTVVDGAAVPGPWSPFVWNALSYYKGAWCRGPYSWHGDSFGPFSDDQATRVEACIDDVREALDDHCKGALDSDYDGWCDFEDLCPFDADALPSDADGDGIPDACDPCPQDLDNTGDIDGDGVGDACDPDRDNDGCENPYDQHPDDAFIVYGQVWDMCGMADVTMYEGLDIDGDGELEDDPWPNCFDPDDDGDGLDDEVDPCPIAEDESVCKGDGALPIPDPGCFGEIWAALCEIGDCGWLQIAVISDNPDPTAIFVFDDVRIAEGAVWLAPLAGRSLAESARVMSARLPLPGGAALRGDLHLVLRDARGEVLAELASWDPGTVRTEGFEAGAFLRVALDRERGVSVEPAWAVGARAATPLPDRDGDGVPDLADACLEAWDPGQRDRDGDGFGDACDVDVDGDDRVDEADYGAVKDCFGWVAPEDDGSCDDGDVEAAPEGERTRSDWPPLTRGACALADVDRDGVVGERDLEQVQAHLGRPVGPSGRMQLERR